MITAGLGGLLPRESDSRLFRKAIKKLHEGELWIDRQTLKEVFSSKQVSQKIKLTKKEIEILDCICEGLTNKEIASTSCISVSRQSSHIVIIFLRNSV
jgi:DNA-binding NarL/FixJ family response regulator